MAFIIPDKILETLVCDSCQKYLSVKPIKVYPNRRTKCGRCSRSKKQSDGVISLYSVIAEKCIFKCINRYDGCRELLTYSQVRDHEKICLGKIYKCPVCPESTEVATFLLMKHFRECHKKAILDFPGFIFNPDIPSEAYQVYLYQQEDNLFFINLSSSSIEEIIRISLVYIGDSKTAKTIHQQFTVNNESKGFNFTSKPKPCSAYGTAHCNYISVNVSNASGTVFITFQIIFKTQLLIQLPAGINFINTTSIEPTLSVKRD